MTRIAVVGPGSVGLFFAGHLAATGADVLSCARRPFDRYVIDSKLAPLDIEASVATDPGDVGGPVDWVLVAVKAHQTQGASAWLDVLCGEDTKVVVLQNGIEHERVLPFINGATMIPSVVYCGAELIEPGRITHTSSGHLIVPVGEDSYALAALFESSQAEIRPSENYLTEQWRKLSLNVLANGLTALTGQQIAVLQADVLRSTAANILRECWTVAAADGADLDPAGVDAMLDVLASAKLEGGTSMLYDTRAGRPTEHDAIHGAALRRADHHGIDMPTVRVLHALLEARQL